MPFRDHFSAVSGGYARYRPRYPAALFAALAQRSPARALAWDCATGTGQAALGLAAHFERVIAGDASVEQIRHAARHPRVAYAVFPAERAPLRDASVDLVTVAQALHWLDAARFHAEARRVARPGALLAAWSYGLHETDEPALDALMRRYHDEIVGPWWPPERAQVGAGHADLPFPFEPVPLEPPPMTAQWALDDLVGYLHTWSATQRCRVQTGVDPVERVRPDLLRIWGDPSRRRAFRWPLVLRVGRLRPAAG